MPIVRQQRYDRSGNKVAARVTPVSDEIRAQVLLLAHERAVARSRELPEQLAPVSEVIAEATALLQFFEP